MKKTLAHTTWECKYHVVWVPKNRRWVENCQDLRLFDLLNYLNNAWDRETEIDMGLSSNTLPTLLVDRFGIIWIVWAGIPKLDSKTKDSLMRVLFGH